MKQVDYGGAAVALRDPEPDPLVMTREELRTFLGSRATVTLWPFCGRALGLSRSLTYRCATTGDIKVLRLGHRCRVSSAWLEGVLFS